MRINARVASGDGELNASVSTNGHERDLDLPAKASGTGSAINGGELLFLALATCYCNDVYREAAKHNIVVRSVDVEVDGLFGAEGEPVRNITYRARVAAGASEAEIRDPLRAADHLGEVHNTLRAGVSVTLTEVVAVPAGTDEPGGDPNADAETLHRVLPGQ